MSIVRRDIAVIGLNILALLVLSLLVIKHFAPGLLGFPQDLILVQEDKQVAPFYENVFAHNDNDDYLISDPHTLVRAMPLMGRYHNAGPNDLLGFRNLSVPNSANVIFIGDSQTYGNNAPFEHTIPSFAESALGKTSDNRVYSMATGAWGALQYYYMAQKALAFDPKVLVVCFYSGNDPLESFALAYGDERWLEFRPDAELSASDMPSVPEEEPWGVVFENGSRTIFTPARRYLSVNEHPVADAGWQILKTVATTISGIGEENGVQVVFTIIPTKELVYAQKLDAESFDVPTRFQQQTAAELHRIKDFEKHLQEIQDAYYVSVWEPLQQAAFGDDPLYPPDSDGHPLPHGYWVVANALVPTLYGLLGVQKGANHESLSRGLGRLEKILSADGTPLTNTFRPVTGAEDR